MSKLDFLSAIVMLMVFIHLGFGQINSAPPSLEKIPVTLETYRFPAFDGVSNYGWYRVNFALTDRTEFSIAGEHYRNLIAERFTVPIQLKQYLSKKTYILGGYQLEWDLRNEGSGNPNPIPRQDFFYGIGHDVKPNMSIEAMMMLPIGTPEFYRLGLEGVKNSFNFETIIKF